MFSTSISNPRSLAMVITDAWVIPSKAPADTGGVKMRPPLATKMFSPVHSLT